MTLQRPGWKFGFFIILLFWAAVSFTDYPAPFIDDLFYIGAAINLVQHGVFTNPYCEMLATIGCTNHFFANMPLHDYLLSGWLKIFGISTMSFHVLYTLLALGVSLLIFRFIPDGRNAWLAAIFIVLAVYGLLGGAGLRADALGLLFLLLGFDVWQARTPFAFFWRNLFLGLVVITFPNVALPAMLLSLFGLVHLNFFQQRTTRDLIPYALVMAAAYAICFAVFLVCIEGRLTEFLNGLIRNQHMSALGVHERFKFFTVLGLSKWVVVQTAFLAVTLGLIWRWKGDSQRREELFFLVLALIIFAGLAISSLNSASGAHVWAFACLIALLVVMTKEKWGVKAWLVYSVIFTIAAFGHGHTALQNVLADHPPGPEKRQTILDKIAQMQPKRLYLDEYAIRELYDYRLPANAFDYRTSSTTGWGPPKKQSELPKDAVMVVSAGSFLPAKRTESPDVSGQPLRIFGVTMPGLVKNPYDLNILDNRD